MPIRIQLDQVKRLTIFKSSGRLAVGEILEALQSFYESPSQTSLTLWDLREASLSGLSSQDASAILSLNDQYKDRGTRRKVALVVFRPYDFGLCKVYQAKVGMRQIARDTEVFYSIEEAFQWLGVTDDPAEVLKPSRPSSDSVPPG